VSTDETGGVGLLLVLGSVVLLAAGLTVLSAVTDLGIAAARARTAADAAALAAAGADADPCAAAREVALANTAVLRACRHDRHRVVDGIPYPAVEVEVEASPSGVLTRSIAGAVPARAAAALLPVDRRSASTASSSAMAPALSRGWLPLPHLGDWTHEGQPDSQRQARMAVRVARR
jgi:hypothetical protein